VDELAPGSPWSHRRDGLVRIVEWGQTARTTIAEALKILRPETHRIAGIVLNKANLKFLPDYAYPAGYRNQGRKYFSNA
jgi:Mrp family chromosome partitioning ATPase